MLDIVEHASRCRTGTGTTPWPRAAIPLPGGGPGLCTQRDSEGSVEEASPPQARQPSHEPVTVDAKPNTVGRVLFNYAFPNYEKLVKRCETDFRVAAVVAAAALATSAGP